MSCMTVFSRVTSYCTTEGHIWRLRRWKWQWQAVRREFSFASIVLSLTLLQHSTRLSKLDSKLVYLHEKKVFKWSWCWLHICWSSHIRLIPADPLHDEGIGLCYGNLSTNTTLLKIDTLFQYDGKVTVGYPSLTATFDPANCRPSFYTHHCCPEPASAPVMSGGDLAQIMSTVVIPLVSLHMGMPSKPPTTPTCHYTSTSASSIHSPTQNTPSKLSCFFEYVKTYLGIENAHLREESLQMLRFGPDILHLVEDGVLKDRGIHSWRCYPPEAKLTAVVEQHQCKA